MEGKKMKTFDLFFYRAQIIRLDLFNIPLPLFRLCLNITSLRNI